MGEPGQLGALGPAGPMGAWHVPHDDFLERDSQGVPRGVLPEVVVAAELARRSSVAVVGPAGSGKTSLLQHLDRRGADACGPSFLYVPVAAVATEELGESSALAHAIYGASRRVSAIVKAPSQPLGELHVDIAIGLRERLEQTDPRDLDGVLDVLWRTYSQLDINLAVAVDVPRLAYLRPRDADELRRVFYRRSLRALSDRLAFPLVVNVPSEPDTRPSLLDGIAATEVVLPRLTPPELSRLLINRLSVDGINYAQVADDEAIMDLYRVYNVPFNGNIRRTLKLFNSLLREAHHAGSDTIGRFKVPEDVEDQRAAQGAAGLVGSLPGAYDAYRREEDWPD